MIAADPVLVARNADPVSAVLSATTAAAAPADKAAGEGDFAEALAQMMGAGAAVDATVVPSEVPVAASGVAPEAAAMLDDLGRMATLVPEAVAAPMPSSAGPEAGALPAVAIPEAGVMPEAVVDAVPAVVPEGAEAVVAPVLTEAVPTEAMAEGMAVASAPEGDVREVAEKTEESAEAEAAPIEAEPAFVPVVTLPKPEVAVGAVAAHAVPQTVAKPTPKAKEAMVAADAPVVAPGQPKLIRGARPVKDSAPAEKPVEAATTKDVEKPKDESAAPAQRARAVVPDGVAVAAPPVRAAEDVAKPEVRLEPASGVADAPAPASGSVTAAASNVVQTAGQAPVMTDRPGWEGVIAERIAADLSEDGSQIEMELSPDNLGNLKITLDMSTGEAQVRFVTETPEAARLIQQNEHRLSEALSRAGLSLGGQETTSRDPQGDRSGRGSGGGGFVFERAAEAAPGRAPGAVPSGSVNLIA